MTASIATAHPSDLFSQAVQAISPNRMAELLSCGRTHIYKQAAHPDKNGEARTSFIEKAERMLEVLAENNPGLAETIVDRLCRICGGKFVSTKPVIADKSTLADELLDNVPAFSAYTETMQDQTTTIEDRRAKLRALINELEQDFDERLK